MEVPSRDDLQAPSSPGEAAAVLQSSRGGSAAPPQTSAVAAEAVEKLSAFFSDSGTKDDHGEFASHVLLKDNVLRALGGRALEHIVKVPLGHLRAGPAAAADTVGRVRQGALLLGCPAGAWLHVERGEVERRRLERRCTWGAALPDAGAWLSADAVAPRWAALSVARAGGRLRLTWPGIPGATASYRVQWRPLGPAAAPAPGSMAVGTELRAEVPAVLPEEPLEVCVVACLKDPEGAQCLELPGAWTAVPAEQPEDAPEPWQRDAEAQVGSLVACAAEDGAVEEPGGGRLVNGRGRGIFGSILLPGRFSNVSSRTWSDASMWQIAAQPINIAQGTADFPEEPRHRALMTDTTPRVLLLEMNSVAAFNMMDPDLAADVCNSMDVCLDLLSQPKRVTDPPRAYVVQGAGPHFCPGGNPGWAHRPGHTAMTTNQYTGYLGFVQCRELGLPGAAALHGSMVGGGVAYSLNCTTRVGASTLSVSYGNLSRGAVPGMLLSKNVVEFLGLTAAVELYLSDGTLSSYAALKGKYLSAVMPGNAMAKAEGLTLARRLAAADQTARLPNLRTVLDVQRYATEIVGINLSAKSGVLFANVKKKAKAAEAKPEEAAQAEQEVWEEQPRPKPKRRPKRRARRPQL